VVGTPTARTALEKASGDRAAAVKSAVRVALRAIDSDSDERLIVAVALDELEGNEVEDPVELDMNVEIDEIDDPDEDEREEGSS
jgi:hypothetical protein